MQHLSDVILRYAANTTTAASSRPCCTTSVTTQVLILLANLVSLAGDHTISVVLPQAKELLKPLVCLLHTSPAMSVPAMRLFCLLATIDTGSIKSVLFSVQNLTHMLRLITDCLENDSTSQTLLTCSVALLKELGRNPQSRHFFQNREFLGATLNVVLSRVEVLLQAINSAQEIDLQLNLQYRLSHVLTATCIIVQFDGLAATAITTMLLSPRRELVRNLAAAASLSLPDIGLDIATRANILLLEIIGYSKFNIFRSAQSNPSIDTKLFLTHVFHVPSNQDQQYNKRDIIFSEPTLFFSSILEPLLLKLESIDSKTSDILKQRLCSLAVTCTNRLRLLFAACRLDANLAEQFNSTLLSASVSEAVLRFLNGPFFDIFPQGEIPQESQFQLPWNSLALMLLNLIFVVKPVRLMLLLLQERRLADLLSLGLYAPSVEIVTDSLHLLFLMSEIRMGSTAAASFMSKLSLIESTSSDIFERICNSLTHLHSQLKASDKHRVPDTLSSVLSNQFSADKQFDASIKIRGLQKELQSALERATANTIQANTLQESLNKKVAENKMLIEENKVLNKQVGKAIGNQQESERALLVIQSRCRQLEQQNIQIIEQNRMALTASRTQLEELRLLLVANQQEKETITHQLSQVQFRAEQRELAFNLERKELQIGLQKMESESSLLRQAALASKVSHDGVQKELTLLRRDKAELKAALVRQQDEYAAKVKQLAVESDMNVRAVDRAQVVLFLFMIYD